MHRRILISALSLLLPAAQPAHADDVNDEYRLTLFPTYKINDDWTGLGYVGYVTTPEIDTTVKYLGIGGIWHINPKWDMWNVLIATQTAVDGDTTVNETRPLIGFQYNLSPWGRFKPFNLARAEYRILEKTGDDNDNKYVRLRNRFGFTVPFGENKGPGGWYGLADAEAFYRMDDNFSDTARVRGGIGYIVSPYVRIEFIAHAQFKRPDDDASFHWTDNIYRINIKISRDTGVLDRLMGNDADAD